MHSTQNRHVKDGEQLSDEILWETVKLNSCRESFACLFDRYWTSLYTTAYSYLQDREKSEEITQDVFLSIWQNRDTAQIRSFAAYIRTATRYQVYEHFKGKKISKLILVDDWKLHDREGILNDGANKIDQEETENFVYHLLQMLPTRCQEIFVLSRMEHLSNDEIAKKLNISKRTVENQITTALRHLRINLKALLMLIAYWLS